MNKKITFINPRDYCKYITCTPYPPLGVGYLASVLRQYDYEVSLIDGQILSKKEYKKKLEQIKTYMIGITATIKQIKEAKKIARMVKKKYSGRKIIIGGSGPNSLSLNSIFYDGLFDILVKGEAEETMPLLLKALISNLSLDRVPNISYRLPNGIIKSTFIALPPRDLDKIPQPARDIYPLEDYLGRWEKHTGMTSTAIMSSRGCPYNCVFCDKTISGRKVRYRSAKNIVDEMVILSKKYKLDDIFFYDDLFVCDYNRVNKICEEINYRKISIAWSAQARVDRVDSKILIKMKKAGCKELYFGAESGSNDILNFLGKGFLRNQIIEAFNLCHNIGIKPGVYLIVGVPGETKSDIKKTISLINEIKPFLINFSFLTPFPNTPIYVKTKHLLKDEYYEKWDEMTTTPYKDECFDINPKKAHDEIYSSYKELVKDGIVHSPLQFICDQ